MTDRAAEIQALQSLLEQLRSAVSISSGGGDASAATIAGTSREVLDGIESALRAMQQQASVSGQRLQRVGESAVESVTLLKDLVACAEQTDILSVNAAIQATLAGEAGNGFAVIADELQRIADRFETICNRVEMLSDMVSNDVQEAIDDNKAHAAELSRSKRLTGDLRTALDGLSRGNGAASPNGDSLDAGALIDEIQRRLAALNGASNI